MAHGGELCRCRQQSWVQACQVATAVAAADSGLVDRRRAERPDYHSQCHGSTVLGHTDALSRPFCGLGSLLRRLSVLDDAQTGNINDLIRKMFYCRRLNDREEALGNTPSTNDNQPACPSSTASISSVFVHPQSACSPSGFGVKSQAKGSYHRRDARNLEV